MNRRRVRQIRLGIERRQVRRICRLLKFPFQYNDVTWMGISTSVSLTGGVVFAPVSPEVGAELTLDYYDEETGETIQLVGRVVYASDPARDISKPSGFGISWKGVKKTVSSSVLKTCIEEIFRAPVEVEETESGLWTWKASKTVGAVWENQADFMDSVREDLMRLGAVRPLGLGASWMQGGGERLPRCREDDRVVYFLRGLRYSARLSEVGPRSVRVEVEEGSVPDVGTIVTCHYPGRSAHSRWVCVTGIVLSESSGSTHAFDLEVLNVREHVSASSLFVDRFQATRRKTA